VQIVTTVVPWLVQRCPVVPGAGNHLQVVPFRGNHWEPPSAKSAESPVTTGIQVVPFRGNHWEPLNRQSPGMRVVPPVPGSIDPEREPLAAIKFEIAGGEKFHRSSHLTKEHSYDY
jgi:hypothetical protein